jgi:hypothetical protein
MLRLKSVCDFLHDILSANKIWIAKKRHCELWFILSAEFRRLIGLVTFGSVVDLLSKPPKRILSPFAIDKRQKDIENS